MQTGKKISRRVPWLRKKRHAAPIGVCFEPLEPRLLLSGSWGGGLEVSSPDIQSNAHGNFAQQTVTFSENIAGFGTDALNQNQTVSGTGVLVDVLAQAPVLNAVNAADPVLEAPSASNEAAPAAGNTPANYAESDSDMQPDLMAAAGIRELVFVSENIADYQQLIADLQRAGGNRIIEVVVLDADRDGIEQVSEILGDRADLAAVHFITHGAEGQILLGNSSLNSASLQQNSAAISSWGNALTETGDILFYGCNIAAESAGQGLLNDIADLTGADVAASNDLTGNAKLGGDWVLEYTKGAVETGIAFTNTVQQDWTGVLGQITVTTTNDNLDSDADTSSLAALAANPGADGEVSLREAIIAANTDAGVADEIILNTGTYMLSLTGANEDAAASGDLDVTDDLIISGAGARTTFIDGAVSDRVFEVLGSTVTISGITIQNGSADDGGGINLDSSSSLTLRDAAVSGNHATATGGGIRVSGLLTMDRATLDGNNADVGGGIYINNGASATLLNTTLSGNTAVNNGGAIFNRNTVDITNSTIAYNTAGGAGGIHKAGSSNASLKNTILANNTGGNSNGALISLGNNIDSQNTAGLDVLLGDQIMTDPLLGVLRFNGGPTKTHALLAGSPAINAGTATGAPTVDQRGISRDATPDIGSFEYLNNILIVDTTSDTVDGNTSSITALLGNKGTDGRISLREAILATNNTANLGVPDIILFNIAGTGTHTIAPTSALPAITDAVTIDATSDDSFAANGNKPAIVLEGSDFGFGWNGLVLTSTADGSSIRGLVIRNWDAHGILIEPGSDNNVIIGNYIGRLNTDGTPGGAGTQNNGDGIYILGSNNIIGGTTVADRNVIAGNDSGIMVTGVSATGNQILGNFIGTDATGTIAVGNAFSGVLISNSANNTVGGASVGAGNLISGNNYSGVSIADPGADNNSIFGNFIGVDAAGLGALGNSVFGVVIWNGASGNRIGGTAAGEGNVIAFNNRGVLVDSNFINAVNNSILSNQIWANTLYDIGLENDGITLNDAGDGDSGANDLLNYPVLTSATQNGTDLDIQFDLDVPAGNYRIEFFDNPNGINASGYGGGEIFLGALTVTSLGTGTQTFNETLTGVSMTNATTVTTTATEDLGGNNFGSTSEFGPALSVNIIVGAIKDTYLDDNNPASNYGTSTSLVMDESGGGLGEGHVLLQFDLSAIPAGAVITNATLQLQAVNKTDIGSTDIHVYEVTEAWDEGTGGTNAANWNNRLPDIPTDTPWGTLGGTINPTVVDTLTTSSIGQHTWDITALVQAWNDGVKTNNGLMLASDDTGQVIFTYDSREGTTPPQLVISYSSPDANTAPTTSGTYNMPSTDEDTTSAAVQVSAILSDASITASDPDGDTLGIAVFAKTGLGTWQYSTDGVDWTDFGSVNPDAALLLSETTWVQYVPDGASAESVGFDFRAWDQSTDFASDIGTRRYGDTVPGGGTTAYSNGSASIALTVTSVNDLPVGVPAITGTVAEDQILTADTAGISDADGLGAFSYRWLRNGAVIVGATGSSYTLDDADVGSQISVEVSYTDGQGTPETVTSAQVGPVANVNDAPVGVPAITGTVAEDQTLTADTSGISDADGLGAFSYRWLRNGAAITGATGTTYTLTDADVGQQISVEVSYTDTQGTPETVTSVQVGPVANVNDLPVGVPVITGTVAEDQTLTADTSGISDADGLGAFSYRWLRNGAAITGATGTTYTLTDADVGQQISVEVSYTDTQGTPETVTSVQVGPVANVNDLPVGVPVITGTVAEDQTLTADTSGISDADGLGAFSYRWLRNGAAITGATGTTYTLTDADVGQQISVEVSYTDTQGTPETVTSVQVGPVANVNDLPVGVPVITGTVVEDQTLTADTSGISDADGLGAFSYRWLRNGAAITGATGTTYTLTDTDVGQQISVEVSYTDTQGTPETVTSVQVGPVANVNDLPVGVPVITGTVVEDQTLTADTSGISDADGLGAFSYRWLRNGAAITGATGTTYTLTDADVGQQISVEVSYTDTQGTPETVTSVQVGPVANVNDLPVGVPVITGTVAEDQTLTADTSGISDADGLGAFSYRWLRNGAAITGATGTTYTLTDADVGQQISVEVSYTDTQGTPETVTSVQVGPVANVNDLPVGVPVITGTVAEDQTLTADTSGISDADGLGAFSYRWLRNGAAITGATGTTYTLTDADVGQQISVEVSYTDTQGTPETVTSVQVGPVANVNDLPVGVPVITGTVAEDQTLTADTSGISDADGLGAFSYRWLRNGAAITGATGTTYTLTDADVGQQISVEVSYTDTQGTPETVTSVQVGPVANVNDLPVGVPVITGTVAEDQTLTADTSGISDADGLGAFSYRWLRNGAAITGATGTTYTLTDTDVGQQISVEVSYTDTQGTPETVTSVQVGPVANVNDPGTVTIDNLAPAQGDTLTANVTDADGAAGAITYQWFRDGVAIGGASGKTYTIAQTDVGAVITVTADYTDDLSSVESLTSGPTAPVTNVNDPGMVSIDNLTPMEGDTLTANVSDTDGATGAISYQWYRDGVAITGATGISYTTVSADEGTVITVTADYTDDQGSVESLTSAGTVAVAHVNVAPNASNLNAAETFIEEIPLDLANIVVTDIDSPNVTVTLTLSDPTAGNLNTGTSGAVTATYSGGVWTASGPIADVNALLAGVVFTPSANYDGSFAISVSVNDVVAAPVTGIKIVTGTPVGDTPQVGSITTPVSVQSDLIVIDRNVADGAEVTHFRIANITNGTLYLADGVTPIHDGDFITVAQGLAGVRFTPVADTLDNGSFSVESSEDGVSVAQQSGAAISVITVIPPSTSPTVTIPSDSGDTAGPGPDTAPEAAEPVAESEAAPEEDVPEAVAPPANRGPAEESVPQHRGLANAPMPFLAQAVRYVSQMRAAGVDLKDIAERLSDNVGSSQKAAAADPGPQRADLQADVHNLISARAYLNMVNSLDAVKKEMAGDNQLNRVYLGSAIVSSIGLSVGYVVWLIRGGLLLSSLLSSLPAWQILDPLPILARKKDDDLSEDEESLESILDRKPPEPKPKKEPADASWHAEEKKR